MELARFTVGRHSPNCSGCPACSPAMAALLARQTSGAVAEVRAGLRASHPASASEGVTPDEQAAVANGWRLDDYRYAVQMLRDGRTVEPSLGVGRRSISWVNLTGLDVRLAAAPDSYAAAIAILQRSIQKRAAQAVTFNHADGQDVYRRAGGEPFGDAPDAYYKLRKGGGQ